MKQDALNLRNQKTGTMHGNNHNSLIKKGLLSDVLLGISFEFWGINPSVETSAAET